MSTNTRRYDYEPLYQLLENIIVPQLLADRADEILYEYARYHWLDPGRAGTDEDAADNLYWLRELRNTFRAMTDNS